MSLMSCSREASKPSHGHRVFLSHSGVNKDFVGDLAGKLRMYHYDPFFDKDSLEVGGTANMPLILEKVSTSKLALFVLSEEFFTSTKNPMLELLAAVEHNVKMLPLFYELLAPDVKDDTRRVLWKAKWHEWSRSDPRIDVDKCDQAVQQLADITGIEYKKDRSNIFDYIKTIAEAVCRIVPPDRRPFDENIVGKDRLCEEVESMFARSPVVHGSCRVLALHGMEGMGKTMLCKALCNFYAPEFEGRVCHLRLHEQSQLECVNDILMRLMNFANPVSTDDEAFTIWMERLPHSKEFFLVFDNIQDSLECEQLTGRLFLECLPFPQGSKVLLLARSRSILMRVLKPIYQRSMIAEFPSLTLDEAKSLFLRKSVFYAKDRNGMERMRNDICTPSWQVIIYRCVNLCLVKRNKHDMHPFYHPCMLESLSLFVKHQVNLKRLDCPHWMSVLGLLEKDRKPGMKVMFSKLQKSFESLSEEARSLFLEIALYLHGKDDKELHPIWHDTDGIKECLENLRDAAFLSKDYEISDVHTEFAKVSARDSAALVYAEGIQMEDFLSVSEILLKRRDRLTKAAFIRCNFDFKNAALDLSNCRNIKVLLLDGNEGLETVNLGPNRLRNVDIRFLEALNVQGLVAHVTGFSMECTTVSPNKMRKDFSLPSINFGNLRIFELSGLHCKLWKVPARIFKKCVALEFVQLHNVELLDSGALELSSWPHVKKVTLSKLSNLESMHSLESLKFLRELKLSDLSTLKSLHGISSLSQLEHFEVATCTKLRELQLPCSLKHCFISSCDRLETIVVGANDPLSKKNMRKLCDILPSDDAGSTDEDEYLTTNSFSVCTCKNLTEINGLSKLTLIYDFYFGFAAEMDRLPKLRRVKDPLGFRWVEGPRCEIMLWIS